MFLTYENQRLDLTGVKAAIFDMDGTLVNSEPIWEQEKIASAVEQGIDIDAALLARYVGRSVEDYVSEVLKSSNVSEISAQISKRALSRYDTGLAEIPGAVSLVTAFSQAGFRIAICSSASETAIRKSLDFLGILGIVDLIVSASTLAKGKPDPLPYVTTLAKLGIEPNSAIVFEDALAGVVSATSAQIKTIWVGEFSDPKSDKCALFAPNIANLKLTD